MRILLYEFVHAGGWRKGGWRAPPDSLRREGAAMLSAVADDFRRVDGVEAVIVRDPATSAQDREAALGDAADFDYTLLIAPETDGVLLKLAQDVASLGGRLLSPAAEFIAIAGDKQKTAEHLTLACVPTPPALLLEPNAKLPRTFTYPAVLKPVDGAGSQDTHRIASADDGGFSGGFAGLRRLERFCPGMPASVGILLGPAGAVCLLAGRQRLSADGTFQYLGGELPLASRLARRAEALALRAVEALPRSVGYAGVDLVLGDSEDGRDDFVIEINPRLTTSYIGQRRLCEQNLAAAMLEMANGKPARLSWRPGSAVFDADGTVLDKKPDSSPSGGVSVTMTP